MSEILPRQSRRNTEKAMLTLATAKMIKARMSPAEKQAKAYLEQKEMNPGDRRSVMSPDGQDVGTVSMSKGGVRGNLTITDPIAFAAWCDERGIEHRAVPSLTFPEWFTARANLEAIIANAGGEMPDGLEDTTTTVQPYVSIRQSETQAANLLDSFTTAQQILEAITPNLIEGATDDN